MAERSRIEWTDQTWNVVTGCTPVSPGCDHCYAETFLHRWHGIPGHPFTTGFAPTVHPRRLDEPLWWRTPRRVFVAALGDLFHAKVPDEFVVEVFVRMWWAPEHTFQVLTKRHRRLGSLVPRIADHLRHIEADLAQVDCPTPLTWPLPNVWLGVSAETQQWADIRIPALLTTPAALRWVSCEPLLGPVDLRPWLTSPGGVDWVVVGGESGPGARPLDLAWLADLIDQCATTGVPVFVKQLGTAWAHQHGQRGRGDNVTTWPEWARRREFPHTAPSTRESPCAAAA